MTFIGGFFRFFSLHPIFTFRTAKMRCQKEENMNYHDISKESMTNGDGIRAVLFVSGCTHHCPGCQNPVTWDAKSGLMFDDKAKAELFKELDKSYVAGVTFSGGDPLAPFNRDEVLTLIKEINEKYPDKTVWVYTGYLLEDLKESDPVFTESLLNHIDVLVEGPYIEAMRSIDTPWVGSYNQNVLRKENNWAPDHNREYEYDHEYEGNVAASCGCDGEILNDEYGEDEVATIEIG